MVAHMPTRISLLWTVVLLTLPCPLFLVYCFAVVPPVAVLVLSANLIEQEALLGLAAAVVAAAGTREDRSGFAPSLSDSSYALTFGRAANRPGMDRIRACTRMSSIGWNAQIARLH